MKITKTNIIELTVGIILYLILIQLIQVDFKSFLLGIIFPLIVIAVSCVIVGVIK